MNTNRLETFADGVFAIAATLLILNVDAQVPEDTRDLGVAATLIAIVSPTVGVILFAAIAALYLLESSLFGRAKQRE